MLAAPALAPIAQLIRSSHERWDGKGFPDGMAGDAIPLFSQIVAACDAYSAQRHGSDRDAALRHVRARTGTQFSPRVVDALVAVILAHAQREAGIT